MYSMPPSVTTYKTGLDLGVGEKASVEIGSYRCTVCKMSDLCDFNDHLENEKTFSFHRMDWSFVENFKQENANGRR